MNMAQFIKQKRLEKNLTQEELGKLLGLKKAAINKYENGSVENIKRSTIEKMAQIFEVKPSILMGWEDEAIDIEINSSYLTVYGKVCAGDGLEAFEDPIDEINNPYPHLKGEFFSLQVQGDSMNNIVEDGLYAVIKKQPTVNNGEIAVVLIDHQIGMLKRFYQVDDMVILRPDSTNPNHKPLTFVGEQINEIKILGKFIGFVSPIMD